MTRYDAVLAVHLWLTQREGKVFVLAHKVKHVKKKFKGSLLRGPHQAACAQVTPDWGKGWGGRAGQLHALDRGNPVML